MQVVVGIDASNLRRGGGVTHLYELLSAAEPMLSNITKVVIFGGAKQLTYLPERDWLTKVQVSELNGGLLKRTLWQMLRLGKVARAHNCDILFVPGGSYAADFRPVVTMSRNMLPFEYTEMRRYGFSLMFFKLLLLRWVQSRTFNRVDGLIFLTEYAKKTVAGVIDCLPEQTITIPHGLNPRFISKPNDQKFVSDYSFEEPCRVVYVSIIDEYKHQWNVVQAIAKLRAEGLPVALELIGPSYAPALLRLNTVMEKFDKHGEWVKYHGALPFENLHEHYLNADIGLFASSCENMPNILLETMASGLPIACSNCGPMPEVLGDTGLYFDPEKPDEIAQALRKLLVSSELRSALSTSSYARAKQYSWRQCADLTFEFLASVVKNFKHDNRV